ncbi:unnamed protein product, partial [Mesorhabditis spiculigera]
MDFSELLQQAEKNKEKLEKKVSTIKSTIDREQQQRLQHLQKRREAEKEELRLRQKRELLEKQRKAALKPEGPAVDRDKIARFKAQKEEDRIQREKEAKKEKERLAELRLQANGGKANKKIARHFGIDPVNMQIRYGNSHEHIETLQKRRSKEQEEQDMLADSLRGGVHKALQLKQKAEQLRGKLPADEHRRVGTSKENSLAGMSSRHRHSRDHFSPPRDSKGQPKKVEPNSKRPPPPAALDFSELMAIASGKAAAPARIQEEKPSFSSSANRPEAKPSSSVSHKMPTISASASATSSSHLKPHMPSAPPPAPMPQKEKRKPFTKGPTPPPIIPPAVPGKKYLPGDVRYQPPAPGERRKDVEKQSGSGMRREKASSSSSSKSAPPSAPSSAPRAPHHHSSRPPIKTMGELFSKGSAEKRRASEAGDGHSSTSGGQSSTKKGKYTAPLGGTMKPSDYSGGNMRSKETQMIFEKKRREMERKRREAEKQRQLEGMSLLERERIRDAEKRKAELGFSRDEVDEWEEELEDEDDYDSEMDDFIDDSAADDERALRRELESACQGINKNYHKKDMWKIRERLINERDMESNFKQIDMEERRSRRQGLLEDIREAKKGNSEVI